MGRVLTYQQPKTTTKEYFIKFVAPLAKIIGDREQRLYQYFLDWSESEAIEENGWFYQSAAKIEEKTNLSYWQQRTIRKKLCKLGLIADRTDRIYNRVYFMVFREVAESLMSGRPHEENTGGSLQNRGDHMRKTQVAPLKNTGGSFEKHTSYKEEQNYKQIPEQISVTEATKENEMTKAIAKPHVHDVLDEGTVKEVCSIVEQWNNLSEIYYPHGPCRYGIRKGFADGKIPANLTPPVLMLIYEFIKENDDWQDLWAQVLNGIKESAYLQGRTKNNYKRPSLDWVFDTGKIPGMAGTYKYKGLELIISGKYAGGVQDRPGCLEPNTNQDGNFTEEKIKQINETAKRSGTKTEIW